MVYYKTMVEVYIDNAYILMNEQVLCNWHPLPLQVCVRALKGRFSTQDPFNACVTCQYIYYSKIKANLYILFKN